MRVCNRQPLAEDKGVHRDPGCPGWRKLEAKFRPEEHSLSR